MSTTVLHNISEIRFRPNKTWLSVGLLVMLLLVYLGNYLFSLDSAGWMHGFSHPLQGWDHQITMLAVGILAAQMRGRAIWMLPLAFVSVMSLGGIAGAAGIAIPHSESIILFSCAIFAVLITRKIRFSTKVNVLIVAFFAFFHGLAHGQEISASSSLLSYTVGFMVATLMLHGVGIIVAKLILIAVACFLSALFTNIAQANEWHSNSNTATFTDQAHSKNQFEFLHNIQRLINHNRPWDNCIHNPSSELLTNRLHPPDIPINQHIKQTLSSVSQQVAVISTVHRQMLVHEPIKPYRSRQDQAHIWPYLGNEPLSLVGFSAYYPNINNSPGTGLLSNGVGLTSPPVPIVNAAVSSAVPRYIAHTLIFEAKLLQVHPRNIQTQIYPFSILSDRWHYFASSFGVSAVFHFLLMRCWLGQPQHRAIAKPVFHAIPAKKMASDRTTIATKNSNLTDRRHYA